MDSHDRFDRLAALAKEAADRPHWESYVGYLELRAKGRRAEALARLDEFVNLAEAWPFAERLSLLLWLGRHNELSPSDNLLIPQPLLVRVVAPTSSEWLEREPANGRANFLFAIYGVRGAEDAGLLEYLRRAARLDPHDQMTRITFASRVIGYVKNAQHELPSGYLGSAQEDIPDLQDALKMAEALDDPVLRRNFVTDLAELLEIAEAWDSFQHSGRTTDFASWCSRNGLAAGMLRRGT